MAGAWDGKIYIRDVRKSTVLSYVRESVKTESVHDSEFLLYIFNLFKVRVSKQIQRQE